MIKITDKYKCCGCTACVSVCPKQCISLSEDTEGFLYPRVDSVKCIDCGLCEQVCPMLHPVNNEIEPLVYAAINNDESVRLQSSSGGIFTLLAESVLDRGGVVFGACFDRDWNVIHEYTETKEGLAKFRGSKYVQSHVGNCFIQVKTFLDSGREVLFSGTPCQVAGLKNYLRKPYSNLFAVDLVCHGVPSPEVWKKYLQETVCRAYGIKKKNVMNLGEYISDISFRAKDKGWKNFTVKIIFRNGKIEMMPFFENPYMKAFLSNLSLRPSCYACPVKLHHVQSDISLADFWGVNEINPELDDDKGCGLVLINCVEKHWLIDRRNCYFAQHNLDEIIPFNLCIVHSVKEPANRKFFFGFFHMIDSTLLYKIVVSKFFFWRIIRKIYNSL